MNRKYTNIFFDLDNTLWDFEVNSRNAMKVVFDNFQLTKSADFDIFFEVYSKNNHKLWELYRQNAIAKKELTTKRFQLTFDELQINGINAAEMNAYYLEVMPEQKQLKDGAIELLQYLKGKSYQISIITNGFKEVQYRKIESSGIKPFITNVYISEVVKFSKPDRRIFEYAIKSSNARKSQSLMIGDDWEVDILGALAFGIDAVYLSNERTEESVSEKLLSQSKTKMYRINSIKSLQNFL